MTLPPGCEGLTPCPRKFPDQEQLWCLTCQQKSRKSPNILSRRYVVRATDAFGTIRTERYVDADGGYLDEVVAEVQGFYQLHAEGKTKITVHLRVVTEYEVDLG